MIQWSKKKYHTTDLTFEKGKKRGAAGGVKKMTL